METAQQVALARWSRRTLLKTAGIGAAGFTLAQANFVRSMAQESDEIQNILDITATAERFGITFLGEGIRAAEANEYDIPFPEPVIAILKAARAQEVFHLEAFESLGAQPLTDTFTAPPDAFTSFAVFFTALVDQEARETSSQLAAMNVFTELGRPDLAKVSFQYAAEEAEHRLLANYTLGTRPALDRAFADNLFLTIDDFYAALEEVGIIGGSGPEITYPGPGEIDDTGVTETEPGGPEAACNSTVEDDPGEDSQVEATPIS
ncbi:MAG: ferritin-like domain-containing protein [Chloroflexia bacterium]|nr:ferritin-like domain-containing protein [Chloroflexia bacterium]